MKNIVFDMGNVLTKYKLSDYIGTYTEDEAQAALLKNQVCASMRKRYVPFAREFRRVSGSLWSVS